MEINPDGTRRPNYFIVGAPRCGTTSLLTYLLDHPEIYAPGTWEFNYLSEDLTWVSEPPVSSDEEYLSHFQNTDEYKRVGEKSAFYLYSEVAPRRIFELNPSAKIICLLRDPVEAMWSLYKYHVASLREDILSFEKALQVEDKRKQGQLVPEHANFIEDLLYRDIYHYPEQLRRYMTIFDRQNIHTIVFDEFVSDTDRVFRELLRFLEVSPMSLPSYEAHNVGQQLNSLRARRLLEKYPAVRGTLRRLLPEPVKKGIQELLGISAGGRPQGLSKMDAGLKAKLRAVYRPEVRELEELIGKELPHWCVSE